MRSIYTFFLFVSLATSLVSQECPPVNETPPDNADFTISLLSTYSTGVFDESAAEIADYHAPTQRVIFSNSNDNTVVVLDISDPTNPTYVTEAMPPDGIDGIQSVSFYDIDLGSFAAAYSGENIGDSGLIMMRGLSGSMFGSFQAGALPDMVLTSPSLLNSNIAVISANEGEPDDDYQVDPLGSITVIDNLPVIINTYDFTQFNDQRDALIAAGVRIYGPNATVAQDLEPEYIAVANDTAYVICQENNAFARFDLTSRQWIDILPFGFKDHSCEANAFDASNDDDAINLATYNVLGMFQPDAVVTYQAGGKTYLLTANEGDARDYDGFSEEVRVRDLTLDPTVYPDAATLQANDVLGRLRCTDQLGDTDGDGDIDQIYSYGARSFSIFANDGTLIWDSGSEFERVLADRIPDHFNSNNDDNDSFDSRSDDKGPEPEAIAIGTLLDRTYAFIGLERVGGIMVYDITDPTAPFYITYFNNRNFDEPAQLDDDSTNPAAGDMGIEDITFVSADDSPNGQPMLITANEVSGTVSFFQLGGVLASTKPLSPAAIGMSIFPNPTTDQVVLTYELEAASAVSYQLMDINGRIMKTGELGLQFAGENQANISLAAFPKGTYMLRVFTNAGVATQKVVRQ